MNLASAAAALLGGVLADQHELHGGDLSQVVALRLRDGREAVAKSGPAPRIEAAMLHAIVAAGVPAPDVLAVDDRLLVLARLEDDGGLGSSWSDVGRQLRRLHDVTEAFFGWDADYRLGPVIMANGRDDNWPRFWAERRMRCHLPHLPAGLARRVERLADLLTERLPAAPAPALLHGDLWGGNILTTSGRVTGLIDPACYHGDGEVDHAMLTLFDRPGRAFLDHYGNPDAGWVERRPIYQLWPALVHLRLFGGGYRGLVERLLGEAGA